MIELHSLNDTLGPLLIVPRSATSVDGRGEATQILLRALKEGLGVGLKTAFTRPFEISANIGDYRDGIVRTLVNASEKKVYITISFGRVQPDRIEDAVFGFGHLAKSELDESQTVFADGGGRCDEKTFLNKRFSLEEFGALVENHGQAKERGSEGASGYLDGFMEFLLSIFDVSHAIVGNRHIVIRMVRIGSEYNDGLKIRDAGPGVVLQKKSSAFFKSACGLGWQGEFPDRNRGGVRRDRS